MKTSTITKLHLALLISWMTFSTSAAEVYVSASSSGTYCGTTNYWGTGTSIDPYRGSFDRIIDVIPSYTTIHLWSGVFHTRGVQGNVGSKLKAGQRLVGEGIDATTVQLDLAGTQTGYIVVVEGDDYANDVMVSNLTVDAQASSSADNTTYASKRNGVNLNGNNCTIWQVKAINCYGFWQSTSSNRECFPIGIFTPDGAPSSGSGGIIYACIVSNVRGNYCSAIGINDSVGGLINGCSVTFGPPSNSGGFFAGFNCAHVCSVSVTGNSVSGGDFGYYTDTGDNLSVSIAYNTFSNVRMGVNINAIITEPAEHSRRIEFITINHNTIELNPSLTGDVVGVQLLNTSAAYNSPTASANHHIIGTVITGNTIQFPSGSSPVSGTTRLVVQVASNFYFNPTSLLGIDDVLVSDNYVQPLSSNPFGYRNKVYFASNNPMPSGATIYSPNATNVRGWLKASPGTAAQPINAWASPTPAAPYWAP